MIAFMKPLVIALAFFVIFPIHAAEKSKTGFAIVLSGGGARGLAQIGVLKAFDEANLKPDLIIGTSMGAIIGSLYASGNCADSIAKFAKEFDWLSIYSNTAPRRQMLVSQKTDPETFLYELRFDNKFSTIIPTSISDGQAFYTGLAAKLAPAQYRAEKNFDNLPIPLRLVATDIVSGNKIVFSHGNLATAVRASCSFPLVFSPVTMDSMLLMDGGLSANIPVETVISEFPNYVVIAIDVTSPLLEKKDLYSPVRLVDQIVSIGLAKQKTYEKKLADLLITPDLTGFANTDFSHINTLIERGQDAAKTKIPEIKRCLDSLINKQVQKSDSLFPPFSFPDMNQALEKPCQNALLFTHKNHGIAKRHFEQIIYSVCEYKNPFTHIVSIARRNDTTLILTDPGIVRGFSFMGNNQTLSSTVKAALDIHRGDTLTSKAVSHAISSLYATELFKNVNISFDNSGILSVFLTEKEYWRARLGLRCDEYYLLEGFFQPGYENLLGLGVDANFHIQYGLMRDKYSFELSNNHVFSKAFANTIQAQTYISSERIVKRDESVDPVDSNVTHLILDEQTLSKVGFLALAGAQVGKFAMLDGGIRIEKFQTIQSESFRNPFGAFEKGMQYFMGRLTIDDLDNFPFPQKGHKDYISIGLAHDMIGGSESFLKVDGSFSQYYTIAKAHTISPQVQFVWATDSLPDVERVYIGGVVPEEKDKEIGVYNYLSFFGLKPRALPGDIALLFRGQYRATIQSGLYIFATIDYGLTWEWDKRWLFQNSQDVRDLANDFANKAAVGIGIGLAYETFFGPIRFSWGKLLKNKFEPELNITSDNFFYFSLGHDF